MNLVEAILQVLNFDVGLKYAESHQLPIKHMIMRVNNNSLYCSIKHIFDLTVFSA